MSYHLQLCNDMKPFQHAAPRQRSLSMMVMLMSSSAVIAQEGTAQRSVMDPHFKTIQYGREHIRRIADTYFVEAAFADLPRKEVKSKVYNHLAFALHWHAHPQVQGRIDEPGQIRRVRVFASFRPDQDDTIEYVWMFKGQTLTALVTRHATRVGIDLDELARNPEFAVMQTSELDRVKILAADVIRLEDKDRYERQYKLQIPWPDDLKDGVAFSTNPDQDINRMDIWQDRLDAYVRGRTLYFIFYKKPGQLIHFQDGSKWFPEEFRAWVHETARQQGKLPSIDAKVEEE